MTRTTAYVALSAWLYATAGPGWFLARPAAQQPGVTLRGELLRDWRNQKDLLVGIVEAMPEEHFEYRPTPAQRTFREQVVHVAATNFALLASAAGGGTPPSGASTEAETKAEVLEALSASYDFGAELLEAWSDDEVLAAAQAPAFLGPSTRARVLYTLLGHSLDTYGQMAVYLRLNGIVPPASAGP